MRKLFGWALIQAWSLWSPLCQWWPCTSDFRWPLLLNGFFVIFAMIAFHATGHGFGTVCLEPMLWDKCVHRWILIASRVGTCAAWDGVSGSGSLFWCEGLVTWVPMLCSSLSLHLPTTCVKFRGKLTCLYIAQCCCLFPSLEIEGLFCSMVSMKVTQAEKTKKIKPLIQQ